MENSISALPNYSGLHYRLYNIAKAKLKTLLDKSESGNAEIKDQIPSCVGDSEPQDLKIALHVSPKRTNNGNVLDPNSRTVTLRSLTNPSVAVTFNAISSNTSKFSPDDKLSTALDFILRLVPQEFNSIETYTQSQVGDRIYVLKDNSELDKAFKYVRKGAKLIKKTLFKSL